MTCQTQAELDPYWHRLAAGGDAGAQRCGWLKDRFGVSWQIVPAVLPKLLCDPDPSRSQKTFEATLQMKKLDIAALRQAHGG